MIDEEIMRQAAEERGLLPSEADVEARIGESFNYFGGDSPPAQPEPTETVAPTPSVTPIPAEGEDPVAAPDPTIAPGPTNPPPPTPTPVSAESFQQEFDQVLADFNELGVGEDTYRAVIESSIIMERLTDALAEYEELPGEDMHASVFFVAFSDQAEAEEALNEIEESDFLTVWNTIRSQPPDPETETESIATASEVLWRTRESYAGSFGEEVADAVFDLPLNTASGVLEITGTDGEPFYIVIQVSGREMRDLSEAELESRKQQLLISFLDEQRVDGVEMTELWRSRVPTSPVLDPKFRQPPTPTPDSGLDGLGTGDESPSP
jgi:hypothetical protein